MLSDVMIVNDFDIRSFSDHVLASYLIVKLASELIFSELHTILKTYKTVGIIYTNNYTEPVILLYIN